MLGHPYVDVWQSVRPERLGWREWPVIPRGTSWKHGICAELGWAHADQADIARAWKQILGTVRGYADLEPSLLATSINCIVAQRLARRLCVHCREAHDADPADLADLGLEPAADKLVLYRPVGCTSCSGTGFAGRVALYEVMTVQGRLRAMIESGSTEEIFAEASAQGMATLRQDGFRLALAGISSLDEIRRVTGDRLS